MSTNNQSTQPDNSTEAASAAPPRVISGYGTVKGEIAFEVTLTHPDYSAEDVAEKLRSGEIYMYLGDHELYDEDQIDVIGTIAWGDDRGDFVPHETTVLQDGEVGGDTEAS